MTKHTPGPWLVQQTIPGGSCYIMADSLGLGYPFLASVNHDDIRGNEAQRLANAALMAAAPDMLAALESFVALLPSSEGLGGHAPIGAFIVMGHKARAAITKAKVE